MRAIKKLRALLLGSTIAAAALLVFAGAAVAQRCEAPPGTAAIDQYCETVPGAKGDRQSGAGQRVSRSLDRSTSQALERAGRDGRGVLALPASGARGQGDQAGRERQASGRETQESEESEEPSGSAFGALGSGIESGSAAGQGFIWLLIAAGVGMAGIAWVRYRRASGT